MPFIFVTLQDKEPVSMQNTKPTIAELYAANKQPKESKRRPNWKALLFVLLFFGLILGAGFLQSPLSAVSHIEVKGIQQVRYEDVLRAAGIEKGMSFWKISTDDAEGKVLKALPLVKSVDIQVSWRGEVVIAIVEKTVAAKLIAGGEFHRLLQDGTVLDSTKKLEADNLPLVSMDNPPALEPGQKVTSDDLLQLLKQIPEVERTVLDGISEIRITAEGPWKIFMRDKFEVRIPPRQFADKLKGYELYRKSLPEGTLPGVINLLEAQYHQPYKNQQKGESKR
jgi:cell division protein FtsQ